MSEEARCQANIGTWGRTVYCGKTAKHWEDGKHYCGIHSPSQKQARSDRRYQKYLADHAVELEAHKAKLAALDLQRKRAEAFVEMHLEIKCALPEMCAIDDARMSGILDRYSPLAEPQS